ncbi:type IX secretion system anionic LPS delivery protein PorZ [Terrimonas alba]|uniref:type IX secretion system anionic LPS delivery protein PorZ n=1 Tax=Terrimonas alba TaxID=3349636 RepID=UPI0035F2364B
MRTLLFITLLVSSFSLAAQQPLTPIGLWRDHLPYRSVFDITTDGENIIAATPYSLFVIQKRGNAIERFSRTTGLNETGISAIGYDVRNEKLVIAYNSSNIDILYRNDVINIPDIKRDNIVGDKTIYNIYSKNKNYYLSTGLGIIVIDGEKYEIQDTWLIGNSGSQLKVNAITSDANFFYAATQEGLKRAPLTGNNPADHNNWILLDHSDGLTAGAFQNVFTIDNKVIAEKDDSLFISPDGNTWSFFYTDDWTIINSSASENKITLCQRKLNGDTRVIVLNSTGSILTTLQQPTGSSNPAEALFLNDELWVADQLRGLLQFRGTSLEEQYQPNSPDSIATGEMLVYNNVLYAAAGSVTTNWTNDNNRNGIYQLREGKWTNLNGSHLLQLDSLRDFISIAVDPKDETIWAGSFGDGLLHAAPGSVFEIFKENYLDPFINDPKSYRVSGLTFDRENNLWISNYGASKPLLLKKTDGSLIRFSIPFPIIENSLTQIVIDDNNYKWIVVAKGGGLLCLDPGSSIENSGDDRWKKLSTGTGNLPGDIVFCAAKDKNGFLWVGTNNGIGVVQCTQDVFSGQGCDAIWPVIQQGNFAGYLFKGEEVRSIAVDGANRKWVATKKGVWLISATGEEVIYQFTEENSLLLSNDVKQIAIDGKTGEVFFATAKGICSFRSTATEGSEKNEEVTVFPNPVPPAYSGSIGIKGLVNNAIVKITELDGRLVYQTRAQGGQAVWNGRDYRGRKISTGVYLVLVSNDERTEKKVAKIVFINK